jgi:endonuclease/exonuclease/phosphatase family metal-dependent hydrolase
LFSWPLPSDSNNNNCGTYQNNNEIATKGSIGSFFGTIMELMDTLYFHWQETGGLYDFSKPSMACRYRSKHTFAASRSKSKKGIEATLWDVPQWWNDDCDSRNYDGNGGTYRNDKQRHKRLLMFNTHLDPWHAANRRKQIGEIFDFIEDTLQSIENDDISIAEEEDSPSSFCTGDKREHSEYDWSQTGVLVVGDFNIKAGSEEYWETLKLLESMSALSNNGKHDWKDYFFLPGETGVDKDDQQHTYALQNSMVEYPKDCGRIDYMFGIQRFATKLPESSTDRETTPPQLKRIRTFMPLSVVSRSIRKEPIGAESSDHYALILEVIPAV